MGVTEEIGGGQWCPASMRFDSLQLELLEMRARRGNLQAHLK
jgi:hypothetical protein